MNKRSPSKRVYLRTTDVYIAHVQDLLGDAKDELDKINGYLDSDLMRPLSEV
jgi:hypothetical protein